MKRVCSESLNWLDVRIKDSKDQNQNRRSKNAEQQATKQKESSSKEEHVRKLVEVMEGTLCENIVEVDDALIESREITEQVKKLMPEERYIWGILFQKIDYF